MFLTGIFAVVKGRTAQAAVNKFAPDGAVIVEFTIGVGGGSTKYPVMWVHVTVWKDLGELALPLLNDKGIAVEASGMLQVRLYEGKGGTNVWIALRNVRELKIYGRDGNLEKVLSGDKREVS